MKINTTRENLALVWENLDSASGSLYVALENLACMVNLDESVKNQAEQIDITQIDSLKQEIEFLLEKKKEITNE